MFLKMLSYGGVVLLVGALVLATPTLGLAQHGGGDLGGFHGGLYNGGIHHGGYGYYRPHYGFYGYGYPYYSYGYPYYGSYGFDSYPYYYDSGDYGSYTDIAPYDAPLTTFAPSTQPDTRAHVTVNVPSDARIWFNDTAMTSVGPVREFNSPPLAPGGRYSYQIKASWNENGHEVTQSRQVEVTAGAHVRVSFPEAPQTVGQASAATNG